jgi:hypothetical protein
MRVRAGVLFPYKGQANAMRIAPFSRLTWSSSWERFITSMGRNIPTKSSLSWTTATGVCPEIGREGIFELRHLPLGEFTLDSLLEAGRFAARSGYVKSDTCTETWGPTGNLPVVARSRLEGGFTSSQSRPVSIIWYHRSSGWGGLANQSICIARNNQHKRRGQSTSVRSAC